MHARLRSDSDARVEDPLEGVIARAGSCAQAPIVMLPEVELTVVVASLALGGAERIVVDWAARVRDRCRVHLVVLRDLAAEHAVPEGVRVSRVGARRGALEALARTLPRASVVVCHLLTAAQRAELRRGGAVAVPVIHNARAGWIDRVEELRGEPTIVAVSRACAAEMRAAGIEGAIHVIRHLPHAPAPDPTARARWRIAWGIPGDALLVGMIGGVKPQKAYPFALRVLEALASVAPGARLVIVGGATGRDGTRAWEALCAQRERLGLASRVVLAGHVADAMRCLPAFDVLLNTSLHEGLSMATLEALAADVPVVASAVGGQGEVTHDTLSLVPVAATPAQWTQAIVRASVLPRSTPAWIRFASWRQWTLTQLAAPYEPRSHVLFVTANLNAGGAQRSLVNLVTAIMPSEALTVAVAGDSTSEAFLRELTAAGVDTVRTSAARDAFDHAEAVLRLAHARRADIVVFWNVAPKVKLLVAKFAATPRLVDVSPGAHAFEELAATAGFQDLVAFDAREYIARLDRLVHKHGARSPAEWRARTTVVCNGVASPACVRNAHATGDPQRIVVNGRIAPTKFLTEILAAFRQVLRRYPKAQLHVHGSAEPRHADYARAFADAAADLLDRAVLLHGATPDVPAILHRYDVALVLGVHQGCPNACLEAMAAGVPVVANDSGGTREIVIDGKTGWLVQGVEPDAVASALLAALDDPAQARRRAARGRKHVARNFSIEAMAASYRRLFRQLRKGGPT